MTTIALAAVLTLCPRLHAVEAAEVADAIVAACEGPVAEPSGERCVRVVAALARVESRCNLYATSGRQKGALQVDAPPKCFGNARIGRGVCLPPHELWGPSGVYHGATVLRWKWAYGGGLKAAVRRFGPPVDGYAGKVLRAMGRVR